MKLTKLLKFYLLLRFGVLLMFSDQKSYQPAADMVVMLELMLYFI